MHRTFEFDDYPMSWPRFVRQVDKLKQRFPNFKCSVFAITAAMTPRYWRPLLERREWIEVCPHGFVHAKKECRDRGSYTLRLGMLDWIASDTRYTKLWKAPWHGIDYTFGKLLRERDYEMCVNYLSDTFPIPTPDWNVWNLKDARRMHPGTGIHTEAHAIIPGRLGAHCRQYQQMDNDGLDRLTSRWSPDDTWSFVSELTRPLCKKIYLGCGELPLDGWDNLDPRIELDPRIIYWEFPQDLPYIDNRADIIFTSHLFNYMEPDWYLPLCQEMFRVLRPGGVARLAEDATDNGYIWRRPGQDSRGTGVIRSLPTKRKIAHALRRAGFIVKQAKDTATQSPHLDVLGGNTRDRHYRAGNKYYLEASKPEVEIVEKQETPKDILRRRLRRLRLRRRKRRLAAEAAKA